ncbi:hypothetical protein TNCT6_42720 [Streptomyces sp. 6-11-2]|nr:hypothetical protein TNCT6_42720 [Streptomyces sp. 6-11-2]
MSAGGEPAGAETDFPHAMLLPAAGGLRTRKAADPAPGRVAARQTRCRACRVRQSPPSMRTPSVRSWRVTDGPAT